jgi:RNA polymerase sigma-70 factor (ECF subfamily)
MDDLYIRKVCDGDTDAFRYLVRAYKDMAFTVAVSVVKDELTAQEVVQDAFMKAFKGLPNFNKKASFRTWFYRIVVNESLQRIRNEKKEKIVFTDELAHEVVDESAVLLLHQDEQAYLVNQALKQLPPNEALVLQLFYLQEESIKEVGEITGWSEANTKVLLHRARKNMFKVLTQLMKNHF